MSLTDPEVVRRGSETGVRHLDRWAAHLGPDPREYALLAVLEPRPTRVLDAGMGDGEFAEWCARRLTADVIAVDQSAWMVEAAQERGIDAHVAGIGALPCSSGEFDVVVANWALHAVADLEAGLADLARVLRPGGRLVALTNSEHHLEELWGRRPLAFSAENGADALSRHFARVERRDVQGEVVFPTRGAVGGYLSAFDLFDTEPAVDVAALPEPFRATTRHAVFVAEKAA